MVYPSGEVETLNQFAIKPGTGRSGWFIHPGKLKPVVAVGFVTTTKFRMVYPSGEVETWNFLTVLTFYVTITMFRMVYPSGEVETWNGAWRGPM